VVTQLRHAAGVLSLMWSCGLYAAPKTDIVVLINGDRMTGEVKDLERGILTFSTEFMGTISIEWEKVAQLKSGQLFEVELMDGTKVYGRPTSAGDERALILAPGDGSEVRIVPVDQTVRIAALDEGRLRDRLDGYVNVGWSAAAANDVSQYSLGLGATYRDPVRSWEVSYTALQSESSDNPSSQSQSLQLEQRRFMRDRWFWSGAGSLEANDELGLDLRALLGGGFGRHLIQSARQELWVVSGLAVTREEFTDGTTQESLEGILGGSYDLYRFDDPEVDISADLRVFPSFTISGRVRTSAGVTASYEIVKDLTYQLSFTHSSDSEPQSAGAATSDWSVVASLGYEF
jgi:putative salt-induced outer membrane protein YdiY